MSVLDFLRRVTTTDQTYSDPFGAASNSGQFDFAPTDTSSWPVATWSPGLQDYAHGGYLGSSYSHIYRSQPSVYTVVEFLAWQISQIGLKVYKRSPDGEKEPLEGPISGLLDEPAPGLTYERLLHTTVADLCVFGNAYWLKMEQGSERWVIPLRPSSVSPVGGNLVEAASYRVNVGTEPRTYDRDQMLHFRRHNPDDARIGVSPLEPLRQVLSEEAASSENRVWFWKNKARIDGLLMHPTKLSDEAYRRLATSFTNAYSGPRNSGKTAILEEGTSFKEVSFSPKDAEFIAGRKLTLETVARAFNIPVSVLGLTETSTYASQKEFHKALYQDTLGPWLKFLEGDIKRGLVRWFTQDRDTFVEFNIAEKLKGSFEEQADSLRAWVGVPPMSLNEWRARFNMPRIDDERFDLPVMPQNVLYGGVEQPGQAPMPQALPQAAVDNVRHLKEPTA